MCFVNSHKKLNINKKGFSLVELLVAIAIFAIVTPVLVEGFIQASKLNYRSRLQQRVDSAANSVYEGISSVKYENLEDYLSEENGWTDVFKDGDGNYTASRLHQLQEGDPLDDCKITVAITKYSESYVVPNLNLIGVNSDYLTLVDEINESDGVVAERIEQYIKTNEEIKTKIKEDIKSKSNGIITSIDQIKSSDIIVECGKIDTDIISKQTNIILDLEEYDKGIYKFVVDYNTQYRYPAAIPDPDLDSSTLKIPYSYSQNHGGKWISLKEEVDIGTFTFPASSGELFVYTDKNEAQDMFIYYNPLSKMDWVDIKSNDIGMNHNVFFVEQNTLGVDTLCIGDTEEDTNNNFDFTVVKKFDDELSPTGLQQGNTEVSVYSNNKNISKNGIPDTVYESKEEEEEENLYRVKVTVAYSSSIFAEVTGDFKAGGGTVGNYKG